MTASRPDPKTGNKVEPTTKAKPAPEAKPHNERRPGQK